VELGISERLMLMGILPKEGNVLTVRVIRELRHELEFSDADLVLYGLKIEGSRFTWDKSKEGVKEIAIGAAARDIIVKVLKELDKSGKVNEAQLVLFDKFEVMGA